MIQPRRHVSAMWRPLVSLALATLLLAQPGVSLAATPESALAVEEEQAFDEAVEQVETAEPELADLKVVEPEPAGLEVVEPQTDSAETADIAKPAESTRRESVATSTSTGDQERVASPTGVSKIKPEQEPDENLELLSAAEGEAATEALDAQTAATAKNEPLELASAEPETGAEAEVVVPESRAASEAAVVAQEPEASGEEVAAEPEPIAEEPAEQPELIAEELAEESELVAEELGDEVVVGDEVDENEAATEDETVAAEAVAPGPIVPVVVDWAPADRNADGLSAHVLKYAGLILGAAEEVGVDPALIAALMEVEGSGPNAVSHAGAMGLMQLMPDKLQASDDPFNPDTNILRAAQLLRRLTVSYRGDLIAISAAYFGAIDQHGRVTNSSDGISTGRQYVSRFAAAYQRWAVAFNQPNQVLAIRPVVQQRTASSAEQELELADLDSVSPERDRWYLFVERPQPALPPTVS